MGKVHPKVDEAIETLNMRDNPTRRRLLAGTGLVSAAGAASALLAACSSSSSTSAAVSSNGKNPFPTVPNQKYYFVNHADTNEFFTPTKYGFSDAAALLGIPTPVWSGSAWSTASSR
jgi:simple sugar transport system substrate-binding protein